MSRTDDIPPADADPETGVAATDAAPDAGAIRAEVHRATPAP